MLLRLRKVKVPRLGVGCKAVSTTNLGRVPALKRLVEPATLGDPMRALI